MSTNEKTPDEIKKGMGCRKDAKWYAEWLRLATAPTEDERRFIVEIAEFIENLAAELETVKRERDAAVKDLEASKSCGSCIHFEELAALMKDGDIPSQCVNCILERSQYVWRGLCKENGGVEE